MFDHGCGKTLQNCITYVYISDDDDNVIVITCSTKGRQNMITRFDFIHVSLFIPYPLIEN